MSTLFFCTDMDGKRIYRNDIPSGFTPHIRTPSPYEFLTSFKLSDGNVYKSPIFIKNAETNSVPVINDTNYSPDSCQLTDSKISTNGLYCHEEYVFTPKSTEPIFDDQEPNQTPPRNQCEQNVTQDLTNVVKCEPIEERPIVNGINKQDIPDVHLTKTEELHNNFHKIDFNNTECNGNYEVSPRKARTRSVESAICDIEEKRQRKGIKRTRSVETALHSPIKLPKLDLKVIKSEKSSSQVPSSKTEYKQKEHRSRDRHEHRSERKSGSKGSHDKKRRCSIGIQARPSQDSGRHYLKLLEPRPCLLESGNLSYPPSDVSAYIFVFYFQWPAVAIIAFVTSA